MTLNGKVEPTRKVILEFKIMKTSGYDYQKDSMIMPVEYGSTNGTIAQREMDSSTVQTSVSSRFLALDTAADQASLRTSI